MQPLRFSEDHEWIRLDGDGVAVVGITEFAQEQLGDIVHVELPEIGRRLGRNEEAAVVESVKAASEVLAPVAGEVVAINTELAETPELANEDPMDRGWFFKIRLDDPAELESLMDENAYRAFIAD